MIVLIVMNMAVSMFIAVVRPRPRVAGLRAAASRRSGGMPKCRVITFKVV